MKQGIDISWGDAHVSSPTWATFLYLGDSPPKPLWAPPPPPGRPTSWATLLLGDPPPGRPILGNPSPGRPSTSSSILGDPSPGRPSTSSSILGDPSPRRPSTSSSILGDPSPGRPSTSSSILGDPSPGRPSSLFPIWPGHGTTIILGDYHLVKSNAGNIATWLWRCQKLKLGALLKLATILHLWTTTLARAALKAGIWQGHPWPLWVYINRGLALIWGAESDVI
ncbi:hypothetical protein KP509_04G097900 [Ceratopteris richardii]|uniref:Uncharacterized protein n=1 Tax=Ceratopteris richardii TaxID=49495 RepID=A0A8T2V366_CERRI|nr:hypothetical protein KP509_04G097900 [Ceratopteris richardii]